ncbi:MAG: tRNA pseudouridine(38-40) synthase TruA [Congregibacter sp.]
MNNTESTPTKRRFPDELLPRGQRLAMRVEYDGTAFCGWQAQPQLPRVATVQEELEAAMSRIAASQVRVHCAGRTDTGVHATAQWVHFDAPVARSLKSWVLGTNAQMEKSVRVADVVPVEQNFHARHSAIARRYTYLIANTVSEPALMANRCLWDREPLCDQRMHAAAQALLGERDFSAFRAASCQSTSPMRNMHSIDVTRSGDYLQIRVQANAFLHHMVRNIVGSLLEIGRGRKPEHWMSELMIEGDRKKASATAPPQGLYLTCVVYPPEFALGHAPDLPYLCA